jgi:hypothetical protein
MLKGAAVQLGGGDAVGAWKRTEVVIEAVVLLHDYDYMLDWRRLCA